MIKPERSQRCVHRSFMQRWAEIAVRAAVLAVVKISKTMIKALKPFLNRTKLR